MELQNRLWYDECDSCTGDRRHPDILGYEGFPECTEKLLNNYK